MKLVLPFAVILAIALLLIAFSGNPDTAAAQDACIQPLSDARVENDWTSDCLSQQREGSYALFYTFSLQQQSDVTIYLRSRVNPYLFLYSGTDTGAQYLDKNADITNTNLNSRIERTLEAGTYTIEATTSGRQRTGHFTLETTGIDYNYRPDSAATSTPSPAPQPTPSPTPSPTPQSMPSPEPEGSPTPSPTPSPTSSPAPNPPTSECSEHITNSTTYNRALTSNCISENRTDFGNHYARHFTFTLDYATTVEVLLSSQSIDTYIFLLNDEGETVVEADDYIGRNAGFREALQPGYYIIEVTTFSNASAGDFTITFSPEPAPSPTPSPTPYPPPSECSESITNFATYNRELTSDCISENRTDYGDHFARHFTFTLDHPTVVEVLLSSQSIDTYIFLLDHKGETVVEIDDYIGRNAGFREALQPGYYIIEVTTFTNASAGDFTIAFGRPELDALTALYESTGGTDWERKDNWLSDAPLSEWHGVQADSEGQVIQIYLRANNLTGEIPSELQNLTYLQQLYLNENDLSGTIPGELGSIPALRVLALSGNELTGNIPARLGNLENLQWLYLGYNQLSGDIPDSLGNLENLERLYLTNNDLSGDIPDSLGNLENLQRLHLTINDLNGSIPDSLGNLSNLRVLSIALNNLTGAIPHEISDLSELTQIYLYGNDLSAGAFIDGIDKLTNLQFLDIGDNRIDGAQVLSKVGDLENLTGLGIHNSDINDEALRDYMADLQALDLVFLNLRGNNLSDPQILVGLSRITTLQRLVISTNNFSGELPRTMTALTLMHEFYFDKNNGLCAPADAEFQEWLTGIEKTRGDTCIGAVPVHAPARASYAAKALAAEIYSSDGAPSDEDSLREDSVSLLESIQPGG